MHRVTTITHTNEGIRIAWGNSQSNVYSNAVYLAEAFAFHKAQTEAARDILAGVVTEKVVEMRGGIQGDATAETLLELLQDMSGAIAEAMKELT